MKKRIVSLVLALCILCVGGLFTSCNQINTFGVIVQAMEKTKAMDSMAAEMKMQMDMEMEGMSLSIPVTADIKATGLDSDKPIMYTNMSMSMLGQTVDMEMYMEDGWAYIDAMGMQYKTNATEEISQYDYKDDIDAMLQEIPEELLKDAEFVENDDGSKTVFISISNEQFAEIYDDYIDSVNETAGTSVVEDMTISDAVVTITVADEYISVYDMKFTMTMNVEGVSTTTKVTASVTYENPGQEVTITPPEGYQDYEEMTLAE